MQFVCRSMFVENLRRLYHGFLSNRKQGPLSFRVFKGLYDSYSETLENKIKCIIHYFERIFSSMPVGFVSFERKVLPLESSSLQVPYPKADFWSKSVVSLCHF
ncbi:hypothetical protein L1049_014983 [Liquidambar formosana]|uniref:PARG helical domain-containing protein n=1 Tax=Liquidambar formosana TaxID=63359 RepID=A0AAP0WZE1_LIQFO